MSRFFLVAIVAFLFSSFSAVHAQDGFVVWAEGSHCDRVLKFASLKDGVLGAAQTAVEPTTADIHVAISHDGVWISFSRFVGTPKGYYDGPCDYHDYTLQEIHIAKIDNGKNLPAVAKKIGYGCWSVWASDENAKKPNAPKTLYYTTHQDKDIKKVVIQPDGSFSAPTTLHNLPKNTKYGTGGHIMASPDGRYVAIRPGGIQVWDSKTSSMVSGSGGSGCHPNWGPRSKYLLWAQNHVCRIDDGKTTLSDMPAGAGTYWHGWSNDKFYDSGKLWMIARTGKAGQNSGATVEAKEVDISGGKYNLTGKKIKVTGNGTTCDIHFTVATGPDTSLGLSAPSKEIGAGETLALTAKLVDDKGNPVSMPINWTVSGGGTLNSATGTGNTFTSNGTAGEFTVTVKAGSKTATYTFKVLEPVIVLELSAPSKEIHTGETLALTAKLVDENGDPVATPINWTVSGGGTLTSATGTGNTFTSNGTAGEFTVTVKAGSKTATYTFKVLEPVIVLELSAPSKEIYTGETLALTAKLVDENGDPVATPINWTVSGGGTLTSATGTGNTFTSNGTAGEFTVTVKAGTKSATLTFKVVKPVILLKLSAPYKEIQTGSTLALTAKLVDEKGEPVATPINWSVSGGGTLTSATGTENTFTSDGTVGEFTITVKAGSAEAAHTFKVLEPAIVLELIAPSKEIRTGKTLALTAKLVDEKGEPLGTPIEWSVSGGGTLIATTGTDNTFTSDGTVGEFTVTVKAESKEAQCTFKVIEPAIELKLSAPSKEINAKKTLALTATLVDENGDPLATTITWAVSGGGSLTSATGTENIFTSDGTVGEFTVTAKAGSAEAAHTFKVVEPAMVLELSAPSKEIHIGKTLALTAKLVDENGDPLATPINWTVSGGGTLAAPTGTGNTFTSDGKEGEITVSVKAGTKEAAFTFKVIDPSKTPAVHIRINCGGPTVGDWVAGDDFVEGGKDYSFSGIKAPVDMHAAPEEVYQTVRHSETHTYTFKDVPDGMYTVRIHFADKNGGREFKYSIEGKVVLDKFDPGAKQGVIKSFDVLVADGNGLTIEAIKTGNDVFEAAIEIVPAVKTGNIVTFGPQMAANSYTLALQPHQLTIINSIVEPTHVSVYDLTGKMVGEFHITTPGVAKCNFNRTLSNGLYFVRLASASRQEHVGIMLHK